jgi:phosphatidylinositol alpha-1,6-mannosyltransferase
LPRKNILVITHNFVRFPGDFPGQFLFTLYHLLEGKYNIIVLCPHAAGLKKRDRIGGIEIIRFRYWFPRGQDLAYGGEMREKVRQSKTGKLKFLSFILSAFLLAVWLVLSRRISLIHCHWWIPSGISGYLASILTGKPLIITSHGTDVTLLEKSPAYAGIASRVYRHARAVTAVSSFLGRSISKLTGISVERITVAPMPFNLDKFSSQGGAGREKGYILSAGRLNEQKGMEYLIKAGKVLKDMDYKFKMVLLGDGPLRSRFERLVDELGLERYVELPGAVLHSEIPLYYKKAEIFVLPSVNEGFGVVLVEALASGAPVIGADSGGITDIIKDGDTGLLVKPKDEYSLAQALKKFLDDPHLARETAERGRKYIMDNFSPETIASKFEKIYSGVN